jgi:hypothetical protein
MGFHATSITSELHPPSKCLMLFVQYIFSVMQAARKLLEDKLAEVASMKEELARASQEAELEEVDEGVSRTDTALAFKLGLGCRLTSTPPCLFVANMGSCLHNQHHSVVSCQ